jgi:hypothetical protein
MIWKFYNRQFNALRNPEGTRPLGRPRNKWEDGIKMDLLALDRKVCTGFIWLRTETGDGLF